MTEQEFKDLCHDLGYCTKKTAEKYIAETKKETFDGNDVIEVYRIEQNAESAKAGYAEKFRYYQGVLSTKRFHKDE